MKFKLHQMTWLTGLVLTSAIAINIHTQLTGQPLPSSSSVCQTQLKGKFFNRTELFFGLSKSDGTVVTESEFQRFVDGEVTPLFPEGLTLLTGTGQFRNEKGTVSKEKSKLLILLYSGSPQSNGAIEQIRKTYRDRFQQESVLRVDNQSCVLF